MHRNDTPTHKRPDTPRPVRPKRVTPNADAMMRLLEGRLEISELSIRNYKEKEKRRETKGNAKKLKRRQTKEKENERQ
jgi:hypothetical protein